MSDKIDNVRFIFQEFGKFVTMDLSRKVVFDDLKMSFTKILNVSFFAKKLIFYSSNSQIPIDTSRTFGEIIGPGTPPTKIEFQVKIEETGA